MVQGNYKIPLFIYVYIYIYIYIYACISAKICMDSIYMQIYGQVF